MEQDDSHKLRVTADRPAIVWSFPPETGTPGAYAALAVAAWFIVSGTALLAVLVVLAAFLAKTLLWHFKPEE